MISTLDGQHGAPAEKKPNDRALVLLARVAGCEPLIWRRLTVRESMWLNQLHDAIQIAFDWFDYQTHEFAIGNTRYGNPFKRDNIVIEDDRDVTLADVGLATTGLALYRYHFGEGWTVELQVEKTEPCKKNSSHPACVAGERAGPPEDCGGVEAYNDMLACIKEPHTEIGQEWIEWLGPEYDAERCDLNAINKALKERAKHEGKKDGE